MNVQAIYIYNQVPFASTNLLHTTKAFRILYEISFASNRNEL